MKLPVCKEGQSWSVFLDRRPYLSLSLFLSLPTIHDTPNLPPSFLLPVRSLPLSPVPFPLIFFLISLQLSLLHLYSEYSFPHSLTSSSLTAVLPLLLQTLPQFPPHLSPSLRSLKPPSLPSSFPRRRKHAPPSSRTVPPSSLLPWGKLGEVVIGWLKPQRPGLTLHLPHRWPGREPFLTSLPLPENSLT